MADKDSSSIIDPYMDELDKLIELKKKENKSLKTIVEAMLKNQSTKKDITDDESDRK